MLQGGGGGMIVTDSKNESAYSKAKLTPKSPLTIPLTESNIDSEPAEIVTSKLTLCVPGVIVADGGLKCTVPARAGPHVQSTSTPQVTMVCRMISPFPE